MRPADTHFAKAAQEPETQEQADAQSELDKLEMDAKLLTSAVASIDKQIDALKTDRTSKYKELRAITSKLVTLKLRGSP